jgi:hypothetical protein
MRHRWGRMELGVWVLAAAVVSTGCSSGTGASSPATTDTSGATTASSVDAGSTSALASILQCAPSAGQVDACSAKTAGDACSLGGRKDGGWAITGTCRTTVDGTQVACAPNLPAFAVGRVNACSGKASGDACQASGPSGWTFQGVCVTRPFAAGLVCGRVHTPPQASVDACAGLSSGEACVRTEKHHRDGGSAMGVCTVGPTGTGPLACAPEGKKLPPLAAACSGLDAGSTCSLGHLEHGVSGTCVTPSAGGSAVCVVPCSELRRHFHDHGWGDKGGWGGSFGPWSNGWQGGWRSDGGMP